MSKENYLNLDSKTVSTTFPVVETDCNWSYEDIFKSPFTVEQLMEALNVVSIFRKKYPNDQSVILFEEIVRDEICQMFGGSVL